MTSTKLSATEKREIGDEVCKLFRLLVCMVLIFVGCVVFVHCETGERGGAVAGR